MIREQRWIPDTCTNPAAQDACSVLEEWDDSVPALARVHTLRVVEQVCSLHAGMQGQELYQALYEQNRRKNTAWLIAKTIKPELNLTDFTWSYDPQHRLNVSFGNALTDVHKSNLQAYADIQFGQGKVSVS